MPMHVCSAGVGGRWAYLSEKHTHMRRVHAIGGSKLMPMHVCSAHLGGRWLGGRAGGWEWQRVVGAPVPEKALEVAQRCKARLQPYVTWPATVCIALEVARPNKVRVG